MFCTKCGNKLQVSDKFCTRCGSKVSPAAEHTAPPPAQTYQATPVQTTPFVQPSQPIFPPAPTVTAQSAEKTLWVLKTNRKLSLLKVIPCYVIFRSGHTILAHLTPEMQKAESARASGEIKENGLGFFKGSAAMMRFWNEYHRKYYSMSVAEIVAECPYNVALENRSLSEVYFKCYSTSTNFDDNSSSTNEGKLYLSQFAAEKIKLTHSQYHDRAIRDLLTGLFGDRLKYRK